MLLLQQGLYSPAWQSIISSDFNVLGEKAIQDGLNLMSCSFRVDHFHVLPPLKMLMSLLLHDWLLHVKLCDPVDYLFPLTKLKVLYFLGMVFNGLNKTLQGK